MKFAKMQTPAEALAEFKEQNIERLAYKVAIYFPEVFPTPEAALEAGIEKITEEWLKRYHWDMISSMWFARID